MNRIHWVQLTAVWIFLLFFGFMFYVTVSAYNREGKTKGIDVAKIQQIRYEAMKEKERKLTSPLANKSDL